MKRRNHETLESPCVNCGALVDRAVCSEGDAKPEPGNITICFYCGHIMAFDAMLRLRELTDAEHVQVAGDPTIIAMQKARERMMKS
jgi:hypothetical protein